VRNPLGGDDMHVQRNIRIPMRDGVEIALDLYRPLASAGAGGRYPVLYSVVPAPAPRRGRTVAARAGRDTGSPAWWVARGYAYARACCRGTGGSGGTWRLLDAAEQDDLYDAIEWLAAQPWCSGRVGMIGGGYDEAQWLAAAQQPPHLACIAPCDAAVDLYRDILYPGGLANAVEPALRGAARQSFRGRCSHRSAALWSGPGRRWTGV
jgi:putative CocE/NonD family hydrolase